MSTRAATEGETFTAGGKKFTVTASCNGEAGQWLCMTHPSEILNNQLQKDFHIGRGDHVLVYVCFEHGPEVP